MSPGRGRSAAAWRVSGPLKPSNRRRSCVVGGEAQLAQLVQRLRSAPRPPERRAMISTRIASTLPSRLFGLPERLTRQRRPGRDDGVERIGLAVAVAACRFGRSTSTTAIPARSSCRVSPAPYEPVPSTPTRSHVAVGAQPVDQLAGNRLGVVRTTRSRAPRRGHRPRRRRGPRRACRHRRSPDVCLSTMVIAIPSLHSGLKGWHALAGRVPGTRDC